MALHRPAEFNKGHVPAFMSDEEPKNHLCVYPFVRSYEWYLLPEEERRAMLVEHGMLARPYPDVEPTRCRHSPWATTSGSGLRSRRAASHRRPDEPSRSSAARRHTREEVLFYTGRRRDLADILASW